MGRAESGCSCEVCVRACRHVPGWFLPGQAEKAANLLGVSFEDFFRKMLVVEFWESTNGLYGGNILLLAPHRGLHLPGKIAEYDPLGRCIFLGLDDRCRIHGAHPYGCSEYIHTETHAEVMVRQRRIRDAWNTEALQEWLNKITYHGWESPPKT